MFPSLRVNTRKTILKLLRLLHIDPAWIQQTLYGFEKTFDECQLVERYFLKTNRADGVLVDVGVAWGGVSLPFLKQGWQVFGFEPDVSATKKLRLSELIAYDRFVFENLAVSDVSGQVLQFYQSGESEGISSLHSFREHKRSHEVATVSLNDYFLEKNIQQVQFLKIDVEGHERWVLEGLDTSIIKPEIIVMEFDEGKTGNLGYDHTWLGDWLIHAGYSVFQCEWKPIERYGVRHTFLQIRQYPAALLNPQGWGNFIGVEQSQHAAFLAHIQQSVPAKFLTL